MPSPIAHSATALAIAHLARAKGAKTATRASVIGLVVAANAADLDLLPGLLRGGSDWFHHGPSHSLAAAVLAGGVASIAAAIAGTARPLRVGWLVALAYASHVLFDVMTVGPEAAASNVPLWWPLSWHSSSPPIQLFFPIQHGGAGGAFIASLLRWDNAKALSWELFLVAAGWGLWRASRARGRKYGREYPF